MATAPYVYGRFIGRVGGLAVALGIGAAIANHCAVATADTGQSAAKAPSSSTTHPVTTGSKPTTSTDATPPTQRKAKTRAAQAAATTSVAHPATASEEKSADDSTAKSAAHTEAVAVRPQTVPVSPLGTPQQLAAEQTATATVNTLPVQLMELVLQAGWRTTAQKQFKLVGGPDQMNLDALKEAVDEYAMGAAFQQQILDPMTPTAVMQVAPPHTWYGQTVAGSRILYDNPDTIYRFMGVNNSSAYVITGQFTGSQLPADTTFSVLTGLSGNTASVLSGSDLVVNPDGSFTIAVNSSPTGGPNHLQLTNNTTLIAVRNTLSDWNAQNPMSLSIARVSGPPDSLFAQFGGFDIPLIGPLVTGNSLLTSLVSLVPPLQNPPPLLRGAVTAVIMALGLQSEATYIKVATTDAATGAPTLPNVLPNPTRNAQFLATQLQSAGYFQLTDDQALVVTINPGNAGYFVVPVTNDWTITDNYWDQQTSLNISQAKENADGTYTLVISKDDPQVWNWVSTGGLSQGTISIRFQDLDPNSAAVPTVSSEVVPLDELAGVLPAGTVYATPAQRQEQIALRQSGFDNRFAPYPQP
jgi:hypothetical protein